MNDIFTATLVAHVAIGSVALILGIIPIFASKGGTVHRRAGRWFGATMIALIGSSAIMTMIAMKPYFAALTTAAGIAAFSGHRVLRRKRPDISRGDRATWLDWTVTLATLFIAAWLWVLAARGEAGQNAAVFRALIGGATGYAVYDLIRFAFPAAWPFFPRLWFYEHLVKMLGGYSAVVAAFSGSVLTFLPIPSPWKQLWPTILFHQLILGFVIFYWRWSRSRCLVRSLHTTQ